MVALSIGSIIITLIIAILLFLFKELVTIITLSPLRKYKFQIAKIKGDLEYYANYISSPMKQSDFIKSDVKEQDFIRLASAELRRDGVELEAIWSEIIFKKFLAFLGLKILNENGINLVRGGLIGLSNSLIMHDGAFSRSRDVDSPAVMNYKQKKELLEILNKKF